MDLKLLGKAALVTGSSKGIGEAIVKALARDGAHVIVHGRNRSEVERVVSDVEVEGGQAHSVIGDVTNDDEVAALVADVIEVVGTVDILVNNAGGSGPKETWADTNVSSWLSSFDRNVLAAVRVSTLLLPQMRQARWGRIINISSLAATMPPPFGPDYAASKAAMNAMTTSMAKAVAADGVTVNAISPGTIHSAALDSRFREVGAERGLVDKDAPWEEVDRAVLPLFAQVPLGRVGRLHEIADVVAFFASPSASYVTGVNLRVDGGMFPGT
jgi:3-oxoacyl-[acyl-carrier protein] reductase